MARIEHTEERDQLFVQMYAQDYSIKEIGKATFWSYGYVRGRLLANEVVLRRRQPRTMRKQIVQAESAYRAVGSVIWAAKSIGICPKTMRRRLMLAGINPDNTMRASLKTHCANGHEYNEENTRIDKYGYRVCRPCKRNTNRRHRAKQNGRELATSNH